MEQPEVDYKIEQEARYTVVKLQITHKRRLDLSKPEDKLMLDDFAHAWNDACRVGYDFPIGSPQYRDLVIPGQIEALGHLFPELVDLLRNYFV